VFPIDPVVSEPPPSPPDVIAPWLERNEVQDSSSPCPELSEDMPEDDWSPEDLDLYDAWADRWEVCFAALVPSVGFAGDRRRCAIRKEVERRTIAAVLAVEEALG
jgi:hypothetical protein